MVRITAKQYQEILARRRGVQTTAAVPPAPKKPRRKAVQPGPPSTPPAPEVEPLLAMLSAPGRHWTMLMPYSEELLTSNQRLHHMAKHRIRAKLRRDAAGVAIARRLPRLKRAAIFYVLHPRPLSRKRDPGNWADTAKHYVDGLVSDAGVLPDDSHEFLLGPIPVMGDPVTTGFARITIVLVELKAQVQ